MSVDNAEVSSAILSRFIVLRIAANLPVCQRVYGVDVAIVWYFDKVQRSDQRSTVDIF